MAKTIDYFSVAKISFNEKNMQDTQLHEVIMSLLLGTYATRVVCNRVHRQPRAFLKVIFFFFFRTGWHTNIIQRSGKLRNRPRSCFLIMRYH